MYVFAILHMCKATAAKLDEKKQVDLNLLYLLVARTCSV